MSWLTASSGLGAGACCVFWLECCILCPVLLTAAAAAAAAVEPIDSCSVQRLAVQGLAGSATPSTMHNRTQKTFWYSNSEEMQAVEQTLNVNVNIKKQCRTPKKCSVDKYNILYVVAGHALAGRAPHPDGLEGGRLAARGSRGHAGAAHCSPLHAPRSAHSTSYLVARSLLCACVCICVRVCVCVRVRDCALHLHASIRMY